MVTVLLAVYCGEKYLREQINSILDQTFKDVKIIIRDDGSSDKSPEIIEEYRQKHPDKISVIEGEPTGSAAANFGELLKCCDDDYIMFADQDDMWFKDKIQNTLDVMIKAEGGNPDTPVLVHSDLTVVDGSLNIIAKSFFEYQNIIPDDLSLNRLLVQNYVTGCTVMINRALKNIAVPIPPGAAMHDWWLALAAAALGKIETVRYPLVYYRQHGDNQVGAKPGRGAALIARKIKTFGTLRANIEATYIQARRMLEAYGDTLPPDKLAMITAYCDMKSKNRIEKIRIINRYNFKKSTGLRVAGQYFLA